MRRGLQSFAALRLGAFPDHPLQRLSSNALRL